MMSKKRKKKSHVFEVVIILTVFAFLAIGNAITRRDVGTLVNTEIMAAETENVLFTLGDAGSSVPDGK